MSTYLDCNATTPIEPRVQEEVIKYLSVEFGNAGSRTHDFGSRARQAVNLARGQVAEVVKAKPDEVVFTSGATESNNLAILGLAQYGEETRRKHIVSTTIEHKAVLEPLEALKERGFEISLVQPNAGGWIEPATLKDAVRADTLLVSVMQVNNETGVLQPLPELVNAVAEFPCYIHIDAAQGFGKEIKSLRDKRIDFISISSHKIYGPKGVGALIARRRGFNRPPLTPLMYGGGQERSLRPGTLPVALIAGLGLAAELALKHAQERAKSCLTFRKQTLESLAPLKPVINGDPERVLPHILNISFPGLDSEAVIVALKGIIAISNGSACTSQSYEPSHVLKAMRIPDVNIYGALRLSWCHMTEAPDWTKVVDIIRSIR